MLNELKNLKLAFIVFNWQACMGSLKVKSAESSLSPLPSMFRSKVDQVTHIVRILL